MTKKYLPTVYPRAAVTALEKQQEAILVLLNAIERVGIMVLRGNTPADIQQHLEAAKAEYIASVHPKEPS